MSDAVVCNIAADISDALETVWSSRIVHRDIKPSNIMYMPDEDRAILIDLAYARHIGKTSLTTFGRTYGTIGYMSPEQFLRAERSLTCKSDVFSLGVVLLESATGCHPTGRDQRVLARNPPQSRKLIPDFPDELKHLFDRMLSRRPAFRPTPAEVRDAMGAFLQG
jgi:serine/threonine protein kinase